jgi:hypothetical protein
MTEMNGTKLSEGGDELQPTSEEEKKSLHIQNVFLQQNLSDRTRELHEANEQASKVCEGLQMVKLELSNQQKLTNEVTRDMTRQYNNMEKGYLSKIVQKDRSLQNLQDDMARLQERYSNEMRLKYLELDSNKQEKIKLEQKLGDMCSYFAAMLSTFATDIHTQVKNGMFIRQHVSSQSSIEEKMERMKVISQNTNK